MIYNATNTGSIREQGVSPPSPDTYLPACQRVLPVVHPHQ
mgnify:CR=1 FL=1